MGHLLIFVIIGVLFVAVVGCLMAIYRKSVITNTETTFNKAHAWIINNGATFEHKIVNDKEHIWTVKGDLKGIGNTLPKAVEDLRSKL